MKRRVHRLLLPLLFPAGVAPGAGGDYNRLMLARNGLEKPVLRGTALAGALRHAYGQYLKRQGQDDVDGHVNRFFGYVKVNDSAGGEQSRLQVSDSILHTGDCATITRTHHVRNRHTGAVADAALFSLEICPPGTHATVALWLQDDDPAPDAATQFLAALIDCLQNGVTLGGNAARGIGIATLTEGVRYWRYELDQVEDHAAWLNDHRAWRQHPTVLPDRHLPLSTLGHDSTHQLDIRFSLGIPRGQDLLVGDGQGASHEIEPQRVRAVDGKDYWRLPGASLRGLFRGWVTRLAAREGRPVADSVERQARVRTHELAAETNALNGRNLGWAFIAEAERRQGKRPVCPVTDLFGSLFQVGRIHIADAYAECSSRQTDQGFAEEQVRMHVAVDRITGGAAEGMLFENTVLTAYPSGKSPKFDVVMRVQDPTPDDARWLAKTLRALDMGILRVGSSKSSGRLALVAAPTATGSETEPFKALTPHCRVEV